MTSSVPSGFLMPPSNFLRTNAASPSIAHRLADAHDLVALLDIDATALNDAWKSLGGTEKFIPVACDVTSEHSVAAMAARIAGLEQARTLVNNAGAARGFPS